MIATWVRRTQKAKSFLCHHGRLNCSLRTARSRRGPFMMHLNFCLRVLSDCMQLVRSNAVGKSCTCDAWTTLAKLNRDPLPFKVLFCFSSTADQWANELSIRKTSVGGSFAAPISSPLSALSLSPAACCHAPTASNIYLVFSMIYARVQWPHLDSYNTA